MTLDEPWLSLAQSLSGPRRAGRSESGRTERVFLPVFPFFRGGDKGDACPLGVRRSRMPWNLPACPGGMAVRESVLEDSIRPEKAHIMPAHTPLETLGLVGAVRARVTDADRAWLRGSLAGEEESFEWMERAEEGLLLAWRRPGTAPESAALGKSVSGSGSGQG